MDQDANVEGGDGDALLAHDRCLGETPSQNFQQSSCCSHVAAE